MRLPQLLLLAVITLAAGYLRLSSAESHSITHPEMYVPGIHLPDGLSDPQERLTLAKVITGTFSSDIHPPGYYVFMWFWTKAFGTSLLALRLPSILFGAACVPLVFWLGVLIGETRAAWIASICVAFSGYQVFWSSLARMFPMEMMLGLLATILLILVTKQIRSQPLLLTSYMLVLLFGVSGHIFFWTVLLTHFLWATITKSPEMPAVVKTQILTAIVASPLIAIAAYQHGRSIGEMSGAVGQFTIDFLRFGFVLPSALSGSFATAPPAIPIIPGFMLLVSVICLALGILRTQAQANLDSAGDSGPGIFAWIAAGVLGSILIAGFVWTAYRFSSPFPSVGITKLLIPLPILLALVAVLLKGWLPSAPRPRVLNRWSGASGLVAFLALIPFSLLALISLVVPILNQRGLMLISPYLILIISTGLAAVMRSRAVTVAVAICITGMLSLSLYSYRPVSMDPADYGSFVQQLAPQVAADDLLFIKRKYDVTPILYYLDSTRYHLVAKDYSEASRTNPSSRIWTIALYDVDTPPEMIQALNGYKPALTIEMPHAKAIRYDPESR